MHSLGPVEVGGEVLIAEGEPGLPAELTEPAHGAPRFVFETPAPFVVVQTAQGVGDGVDVGTDGQSV
ncbi:unannotated protein [freshwater metagenome]|uniref:Unannotated protein n=1 Tax=freshwater metagenome TaxID=449393 RepID=A0A6J6X5H9_9ZZZZ